MAKSPDVFSGRHNASVQACQWDSRASKRALAATGWKVCVVCQYVLQKTADAHVLMFFCLCVLLSRLWIPFLKAPRICCLTCDGRDTNCMHEQNLSMGMACCRWLREEKRERKLAARKQTSDKDTNKIDLAQWSNGWAPGRMTASIRDSSNTVMRM